MGCWLLQPAHLSTRTYHATVLVPPYSMDHVRHDRWGLGPLLQLHCSFRQGPSQPGDIGISPRQQLRCSFPVDDNPSLDQLFHTTGHEILAAEFLRWHLLPFGQRAAVSTSARMILSLLEAGSPVASEMRSELPNWKGVALQGTMWGLVPRPADAPNRTLATGVLANRTPPLPLLRPRLALPRVYSIWRVCRSLLGFCVSISQTVDGRLQPADSR